MKFHLFPFLPASFFLLLACGSPSGVAMAGEDSNLLRQVCLDFTNQKRATESKAPLLRWESANNCADKQAMNDQADNSPHGHFGACGESAQNTCPNWPAGDSLAQVKAVRSCLQMMWNEGPGVSYSAHGHYLNMSSTSYTQLTCGFHIRHGSIWINMDFK
jgi:hypothetical protein